MNVDTRRAVGLLAHEPRDEGNVAQVELVGDAMDQNRVHARVAEDDFLAALRGRVTLKRRLGILEEERLQTGQLVDKLIRDLLGLRSSVLFRD